MKIDRLASYAFSVIVLIAVLSCGGGGLEVAGGGIGGTGFRSVGAITALGSITVNEVVFDTAGARIFMESLPADQSALRVGMVVEVEGTLNPDGATGRAETVRFSDSVKGPVTRIDPAAGLLEILGQTVFVDPATHFDEPEGALSLLEEGDVVAVSGHMDGSGAIRATFIRVTAQGGELNTTGVISSRQGFFFRLGGLTVDFSSALLSDFDGAEPAQGDFVQVKGRVFDPASGVLYAEAVERKELSLSEAEEIEVEGFIHAATPTGFILATPAGTIHVRISASTLFEDGTAADILPGNRVEAEGVIIEGIAMAEKITFRNGARSLRATGNGSYD